MKRVAKLVSRTPPEGLTDWAPVRDNLEIGGLVYEAVWIPDRGLEQILDDKTPPRYGCWRPSWTSSGSRTRRRRVLIKGVSEMVTPRK